MHDPEQHDRTEVQRLAIALHKVILEFLRRRGDAPWRLSEAMHALAAVTATVIGVSNGVQTSLTRRVFEVYLDDALAALPEQVAKDDDTPSRLN
jgi:hypothetical protein